jgi:hypothetical protein
VWTRINVCLLGLPSQYEWRRFHFCTPCVFLTLTIICILNICSQVSTCMVEVILKCKRVQSLRFHFSQMNYMCVCVCSMLGSLSYLSYWFILFVVCLIFFRLPINLVFFCTRSIIQSICCLVFLCIIYYDFQYCSIFQCSKQISNDFDCLD